MPEVEGRLPLQVSPSRLAAEWLLCAAHHLHHCAAQARHGGAGTGIRKWLMQAPTLASRQASVDASRHGRRGGTRCPCEIKCIIRLDHTAFFLTV
jgi:hypothetical protein